MITVCLIIAGCLLAVGAGLYFQELRYRKRNPVDVDKAEAKEAAPHVDDNEDNDVCCGQHATCEKTSLVATTVAAPVY